MAGSELAGSLLIASDVAEVPLSWPQGWKRELTSVLERVAVDERSALNVAASDGIKVMPAPGNHRLYFRRGPSPAPGGRSRAGTHNVTSVFGLRPAPADELQVRAGVVGPNPQSLALLSAADLQRLGVPSHLVHSVRTAPSLDALLRLGLPEPVMDRLRAFCVAAAPAEIQFIPEVLKYEVPDLDTLRRYYLGDLKRLLLNLEVQQRELVDLDPRGPILVKGAAGSGKTTVALYRARRLLLGSPGGPRVLFLSFTKALTQVAEELLLDLCERQVPELSVQTLHAWCYGYVKSQGKRVRIASEKDQSGALAEALAAVQRNSASKLLERPSEFWFDEFGEVIKGRCASDRDAYFAVERIGRGEGLRRQGREIVWEVFEGYQRNLRRRRCIDWDDLVLEALSLRRSDSAFQPYDHVFLDEAQDLPVAALQLVTRLTREPSGLFFMADGRQSIYQKGFRWKDVGLALHGRPYTLRRNFRSTIEITAAADSLRAAAVDETEEDGIEPPVRHGPRPKLVPCSSQAEECGVVARRIGELLRTNAAAPANIGVFARRVALARQVYHALGAEGIPARMHNQGSLALGDPTVKVLTLHSAKGLEFPLVFIVGVDAGILPEELELDDKGELEAHLMRERRLLYVGMTRAMQDLTMVYDASRPSRFIGDLDRELFDITQEDASDVGLRRTPAGGGRATAAPRFGKGGPRSQWGIADLLKRFRAK